MASMTTTPSPQLEELLGKLQGVRRNGNQWMAKCPCHDDKTPSLSVSEAEDGKPLFHCHAGCSQFDVMKALDWQPELSGEPEAIYRYTDEESNLLYEVVRYPGKRFRQRHWTAGEDGEPRAVNSMDGVPLVLYRLANVRYAIAHSLTVYLCEGEKDVHAVSDAGHYFATCNPGGAGKWRDEWSEMLRGADVIQIVDKDEPGRAHAEKVKRALDGIVKSYRAVQAKQGKDAYDHLVVHGLSVEEFEPLRELGSWERVSLNSDAYNLPVTPPNLHDLIYAGKRHAISGPPEATKTLVSLIFGLTLMRDYGENFALVDFEMGGRSTRQLLADLGATDEEIGRVYYIEEPESAPTSKVVDRMQDGGVTLAIIDSAAGAYLNSGLDDNSRRDAEKFAQTWVGPLWRRGITTILLDHVVKNQDARGRYAIGSERKLGAVDVHLGFDCVSPLNRGGHGLIRVLTHKDRPGYLMRPQAAEINLRSDPRTHRVSWDFTRSFYG